MHCGLSPNLSHLSVTCADAKAIEGQWQVFDLPGLSHAEDCGSELPAGGVHPDQGSKSRFFLDALLPLVYRVGANISY